ncbi:MAG: phosphogluconate dehydratase [Pseudomonadota bacterium]
MTHPTVAAVTARIIERSAGPRRRYLDQMARARDAGVARAHLGCSNLAHAAAAMPKSVQAAMAEDRAPNIGIVTAYNDMLSAHAPFEGYPALIKRAAEEIGATAQVAGGVPAMCDGVTQGQPGMDLSLFSRDVIAMSAAVALSHNCYDAVVFLGMCDKIVPGLVIAAARFGHLPAIFLPAGPMPSGLPNDAKARTRERFAAREIGRKELLASEMQSYHAPGICTFYGTANTNQMLMEVMGLHLPGSSHANPAQNIRDPLTMEGARRVLSLTAQGDAYTPACEVLSEKCFVNGIVGLHATGGSTNLLIHLIAMARAAGVILTWDDVSELSEVVPLIARIYPNGLKDVNHFYAAGGLPYLVRECLGAGLMQDDVRTVAGDGLGRYTEEPRLSGNSVKWHDGAAESLDRDVLRPVSDPFQPTGGLVRLTGPLGDAVMKVSAVKPERRVVRAPARIFHDQESVKAAFRAGELDRDMVCVVRFQGPRANGMPELHGLTPVLGVLQDRGHRIALVTDGRMSGASGKIPAAIHVSPEAAADGPIARLQDGDMICLDGDAGTLDVEAPDLCTRPAATERTEFGQIGVGREMFEMFRHGVGAASMGASVFSFGEEVAQ